MKTKKKTKLYEWQQKAKTGQCERCGSTVNVTVDHIIPVSLLKELGVDMYECDGNFQLLCRLCNTFKANRLDHLNPNTIPLLKKYVEEYEKLSTVAPLIETE